MKLTLLSDTHGHHRSLRLPPGDVLLHAGDITGHGHRAEVEDFLEWFAAQDYTYKVFIGGNHDFFLDQEEAELLNMLPVGITYLNNEDCTIGDLKIWGAPATPDLVGWAFGKQRSEMEAYWRSLPRDIDILLTHTPPLGILDRPRSGGSLGCAALLRTVREIKPWYHVFGHIHAGNGRKQLQTTTFINASILDSRLGPVNTPVVLEV